MKLTKKAAFVLFVCVAMYRPQDVETFHNGYTRGGLASGCNYQLWYFQNHPHTCSAGAGFVNECRSWCEDLSVLAHCTDYAGGTSTGDCECPPPICCESNGCQWGNSGANWSTYACGGDPIAGPDACGCCQASSSPIIVSLRNSTERFSSAPDGVVFDFFGDGQILRYAWPIEPDDAWLVLDRNHNGQVDNASELFGNFARLKSGDRAAHGYELLDDMDDNRDGTVDYRDRQFGDILLWRDVIRNGRVDARVGELFPATRAGITGFETRFRESRRTDRWGNEFKYRGVALFAQAPHRRPSFDVFLTSTEPDSH